MEIKLDEIELLTILHGLEALYDQVKEYKDLMYDNQQDFLNDLNETRMLHNKLLIQAHNDGYLQDISLI